MKIEWDDTEIIRGFEGYSEVSYRCSAGVWTIGHGLTGPDIVEGVCWSEEKCRSEFLRRIDLYCEKLDKCLPSNIPKNKYIACLSLAWNIGMAAFQTSTLLKYLKLADYGSAASEFTRWDKISINGKKVMSRGLHERRVKERQLFLTP